MPAAALLDRPWLARRKLDVTEYHRMAEVGILGPDDRVELIEGELIAIAPIGDLHAGTTNRLTRMLVAAVGDRAIVAVGNPIRLGDNSEPQPDFALLRPRPGDYDDSKPTAADVLFLIEVADSSLRVDRRVKLLLYARHGVPEVWIVDLPGRVVEVYREPGAKGYAARTRAEPGASIEPALLPGLSLAVADFLR